MIVRISTEGQYELSDADSEALNELDNVDFRAGSLFEPAAGERFDLITCNAPFVVSPDNHLVYRDSGFEGDGVTERIVRALRHPRVLPCCSR